MPGQEGPTHTFLDPRDRFWSRVHASAEARDKTRAEHWKGTTDGILIFTGLFAATVASFVVYTLPMLSPDTGSQTVVLLSHVLLVLANNNTSSALSNSLPFALQSLDPGSPDPSATIINICLLMSLFLSLCCALASTLVQQWGRSYIHDSNRHATLGKRGLVHAGLERGIKSSMDVTVALIVTVLHVSVFMFFAGLIVLVFTTPHLYIKWTLTAAMTLFSATYILLSIVPFRRYDLPFSTPFSWGFSFIHTSCRRIHFLATANLGDILDNHGYRNAGWPDILRFVIKSFWRFVLDVETWSTSKRSACLDESLHRVPNHIRASWVESAFSRLDKSVEELGDAVSLWESFLPFISTPNSDTDRDLVRTLREFAASDQYNLRLFWYRIKSILLSLDSNKDGDMYFGRAVIACCSFTRYLLDIGINEDDMETISSESRALIFRVYPQRILDTHVLSDTPRARSSGALMLLNAELRISIHDLALKNERWLDDVVYRTQYADLRLHMHTGGRDAFEVINATAIHVQLVLNFIDVFMNLLLWSETMGLPGVFATLKETSWIPVLARVHAKALFSAQDEDVSAAFIDEGHHSQACPYPSSTLQQLLTELGVVDYRDLEVGRSTDGDAPASFNVVSPDYRPLLQAYPELSHMVYSLCAMVLDRRDVTALSRPSTRARTVRSPTLTIGRRSGSYRPPDAPMSHVVHFEVPARSSIRDSVALHPTTYSFHPTGTELEDGLAHSYPPDVRPSVELAPNAGEAADMSSHAQVNEGTSGSRDQNRDGWGHWQDDTLVDALDCDTALSSGPEPRALLHLNRGHRSLDLNAARRAHAVWEDVQTSQVKSRGSLDIGSYRESAIADSQHTGGKRNISLSRDSVRAVPVLLLDMQATMVHDALPGDGPAAKERDWTVVKSGHRDRRRRESIGLLDAYHRQEHTENVV